MCGGTYSTQSNLPNRHQIRSAMRKVARVMRRKAERLSLDQFVYRVMVAGEWTRLPLNAFDKTQAAILKSLKVSTFFNQKEEQSFCGSYFTNYLTVRKSAIL